MQRLPVYILVAALVSVWPPRPARAWGPEGHAVVSRIAAQFLTPRADEKLKAILQDRHLDDYDVASWPDMVRGNREYEQLYPGNGRWHYVDFDAFAHSADLRLPEDGQDVVSQITRWQVEVARSRKPAPSRLDALRFLVHFVGDLHQPLHCAYRYNDMGGNMLPVHSFRGAHFRISEEEPMDRLPNLHSTWDEYMVYEVMDGLTPEKLAAQLAAEINPEQARAWAESKPLDWAMESYYLARKKAYRFTDGSNLPFTWTRPGMDLTLENYIESNVPVVREQLQKAGVRLAALLNAALDPKSGGFPVTPKPSPDQL